MFFLGSGSGYFSPFPIFGRSLFQLFVGVLAMIGVSELLKMKALEIFHLKVF